MYDDDKPTAQVTPLAMQEHDYDSKFYDSMTALFDVKSHTGSQTRFKYAETIMKLEDDMDLLEGGSREYSKRLIERLFELKSKAFFNVA